MQSVTPCPFSGGEFQESTKTLLFLPCCYQPRTTCTTVAVGSISVISCLNQREKCVFSPCITPVSFLGSDSTLGGEVAASGLPRFLLHFGGMQCFLTAFCTAS